jgi:glycerol uptake facilitator-like aquaporin
MLTVLLFVAGPVSGAHLNPLVSIALAAQREFPASEMLAYICAQIGGAILGVWIAHAMFNLPILQLGNVERSGVGQWLGEAVATFGLLLTVFGCRNRAAFPFIVALYIAAAFWFTSSTSFANPAVTIARSLSGTFAGISPVDAPMFLIAQAIGALAAVGLSAWMFDDRRANA